jgi:hypothetical protein
MLLPNCQSARRCRREHGKSALRGRPRDTVQSFEVHIYTFAEKMRRILQFYSAKNFEHEEIRPFLFLKSLALGLRGNKARPFCSAFSHALSLALPASGDTAEQTVALELARL